MNWKEWIYNLCKCVIGGAAATGSTWMGIAMGDSIGLDMPQLNWKGLLLVLLASTLSNLFFFLKQSPLPKWKAKIPTVIVVATIGLIVILSGCARFPTQVFRLEQSSTQLAYTAYMGWTNYMAHYPVTLEAASKVKQARLQFAATARTIDALRYAYETNREVRPMIEATLITFADQSSNIVWLVNYYQGK